MRLTLFAPLALAAACVTGPRGPDFYTTHGTAVYLEASGLDRATASAMETQLLAALRPYGYTTNGAPLRLVTVEVVPEAFPCNTLEHGQYVSITCAGVEDRYSIKIENRPGCEWRSSYRHEILHYLQWTLLNVNDYDHTRPEWAAVNDPAITCAGPTAGPGVSP